MVIHTKQQVVADLQHFTEHLERVSYHVEPAAIVVNGLDSNLFHNKTESIGQHEDFGIESPAFNPLAREGQSSRLAVERLEAALRVCKAQSKHGLDDHFETCTAETSVPRRRCTCAASLCAPRTNRDVRALFNRLEELRSFVHRHGKIGIS